MHVFNRLYFYSYCSYLGLFSGLILAVFLKATMLGTTFLWQTLPQWLNASQWYPLIIGGFGGAVIGLLRKKYGDYPQTFFDILATIKNTGSYPYQKTTLIFIATLLPLIFGSSVGMVAGMIGIIAALFFWSKNKLLTMNKKHLLPVSKKTTDKATASALSNDQLLSRATKFFAGITVILSALLILLLIRHFFGKYSAGFPRFIAVTPTKMDLLLMIVYLVCGIGLGLFFKKTDTWCATISHKIPPVLQEILAGLSVGLAIAYLPFIPFSGQNQMLTLLAEYQKYAPLALIGVAFLKIILTNFCIQLGLKGGFFFPLVLAAVCLGFGLSLSLFPTNIAHATFAAAILSSATLSVFSLNPLLITGLLLLCFPLKLGIWIFTASLLVNMFMKRRCNEKKA